MSCSIDIQEKLDEIDALLEDVNTALRAILTGGHQEYWLSTGQTDQRVRRLSLKELRETRKDLLQEKARLLAACAGPSTTAIPDY